MTDRAAVESQAKAAQLLHDEAIKPSSSSSSSSSSQRVNMAIRFRSGWVQVNLRDGPVVYATLPDVRTHMERAE
jgi:hypothetical protein